MVFYGVCVCVCVFGDCQILGLINNQSLTVIIRAKALYHLSTRFLVHQYDLLVINMTLTQEYY